MKGGRAGDGDAIEEMGGETRKIFDGAITRSGRMDNNPACVLVSSIKD